VIIFQRSMNVNWTISIVSEMLLKILGK
jgi:hypothetical protein